METQVWKEPFERITVFISNIPGAKLHLLHINELYSLN